MNTKARQAAVLAHAHSSSRLGRLSEAIAERTEFRDERGDVTPRTIMVFIFAALALAVGGIITTKVTGKANAISVD